MNIALWICQGFLLLIFLYSGITKATLDPRKLVEMGQTGVDGLPAPLIRFIGVAEVLGSIGITVPWMTHTLPALTSLAAACFGVIMLLAARVHYRRNEMQTVGMNILIMAVAIFVAIGRANAV
jgi:uncharacterized membrane protein YphA (DoxX/SURF4 family)